ncbi:MAG: hypothetical protein EOO67_00915 [Microbacterium sp.]|nr:MAG: hypothetical protein EOO67_00915 [Microbacterium sp.]
MRRAAAALMVLIGSVALAGCSAPHSVPESAPSSPPAFVAESTPDGFERWDLVGLWRVSDAEGTDGDTWLYLGADEARVWSDCGFQFGGWSAGGGKVIVDIYMWHMGCSTKDGQPAIPWLSDTVGYESAAEGWTLLSATGEVTARLRIDGVPPPHPDTNDDARQQPVLDDDLRTLLRDVSPPDDMRTAAADELAGRWIPEAPAPRDPHVAISADGTWTASDGCNGTRGRWAVAPDESLLTTTGPTTLIGCEGSGEPGSFGQARAAAFDGDVLVLFDGTGAVTGRLVRADD